MISLRDQQGAILIVALVTLLVMTLLGVATMQSSTLQERMSSNARQQQLSRNAAEHALRQAEQWLITNVRSTADLSQFNGAAGLYSAIPISRNTSVDPLPNNLDLTSQATWLALGQAAQGLNDNVTAQDPRFIIEYIGRGSARGAASEVTELGAGAKGFDEAPYAFRITAIGWGRDTNIYSVLESSFLTGTEDFIY